MSEKDKEQMERLKLVALKPTSYTTEHESRLKAVDAIAAFGDASIPTLIEISEMGSSELKERALDWIAKLKSGKKGLF